MHSSYSRKSLVRKLGIKAGFKLAILNPPGNYENTLGELPKDITVTHEPVGRLDFVQIFATDVKVLQNEFGRIRSGLDWNGMVWICWPKSSSGLQTSLNENAVREIGLKNGLVDVKICAVDSVWSGLKFVRRREDRHQF